jgi:murein DD-endopeptidase MepM/ murein hydrolase activator NlpD
MKPPLDNFSLLTYPSGQVTQFFGENEALYSRFGMKGHNGIDLVAPHGSPMYAIEDATVVNVNDDPKGFGKHVRIITYGTDCREWTYGHCAEILVKVGDTVSEGQKIATMGNTGFVVSGATPFWKVNPYAGTHLHLGLREVRRSRNGWSYPGSTVKIDVLNYQNGYKGAIDPVPWLNSAQSDESTRRQQMLTVISLLNSMIRLLQAKR